MNFSLINAADLQVESPFLCQRAEDRKHVDLMTSAKPTFGGTLLKGTEEAERCAEVDASFFFCVRLRS